MYEKFLELPADKQQCIINAAMEIFSKNDYKRAVTDDIAAKAGISKGSLFYYFYNKKSLYLYLYQYTTEKMAEQIVDETYWNITDFFELLGYCARKKAEILVKNPYILDFAMRSFYPDSEALSQDLDTYNQDFLDGIMGTYLKNVDFSKFREGMDPLYIFRMLIWMSDGYLHEKRTRNLPILLEDLMDEFNKWMNLLRPLLYKEEYL